MNEFFGLNTIASLSNTYQLPSYLSSPPIHRVKRHSKRGSRRSRGVGRHAYKLRMHPVSFRACLSGRHGRNRNVLCGHIREFQPWSGTVKSPKSDTVIPHTPNIFPFTNPPWSRLLSGLTSTVSPPTRGGVKPLLYCLFGHFLSDSNPLDGVDRRLELAAQSRQRSDAPSVSSSSSNAEGNLRSDNLRSDKKLRSGVKSRSDRNSRSGKKLRSGMKLRSGSYSKHKSCAGHPYNRLYIDSGASVHILFNDLILGKRSTLNNTVKIAAAGDPINLNEVASLHKAFAHLPLPTKDLYYEPGAIANLLSFARLADEYYIICNTRVDDAIYVQSKEDGKYLRFQRCRRRNLYYLDIGSDKLDGDCMFSTVKKGKLTFSTLDQKRAQAVRLLQEQCGFPADEDFINALECNVIPGVDFGRRDVKIANVIYGYSKGAAMGKWKHPRKGQKMDRTTEGVSTPVPRKILEHYGDVHLDMDLMFINGVAFFLSTSRDLGFIHCRPVVSKHNKRVQNALKTIVAEYNTRGFKVRTASGDNAFAPLKDWMLEELDIVLTTCDSDSHVPRVENSIKFVKERVRCIQSELPFKKLPRRFTIEIVKRVVVLINSFARKSGVHSVMSPRQIMFGRKFIPPLCKIGELVLSYDTYGSNDTGQERAFYGLYIGPNENGTGHRVFKLQTKHMVTTPKCKMKPMPEDVIDIVNKLGEEEGVPDGIQFLDVHGKATLMDLYPGDENDDDSQASDVDYEEESDEDDESLIIDEDADEEESSSDESDSDDDDDGNDDNMIPDHRDEDLLEDDHDIPVQENEDTPTDVATPNAEQVRNQNNSSRNTRRRGMLYEIESTLDGSHWRDQVVGAMINEEANEIDKVKAMKEYFNMEASKSTPQYGFRKGLEIFGDDGKEAAINELKNNLVGRGCLNMLTPAEITPSIRKKALSYLMFLKRKRCGKIKGRGCADGRPQREYITKEESRSPTVALYALMASCVMDAIDHRKVVTVDIPGAFLQGDWPGKEHPGHIKFTGIMVELLCEIDPSLKDHIVWSRDGKQKYIYGELKKAVYGTLLAAIIFYNKLSDFLLADGFIRNEYDECTFNKMVNGHQLTVQFHVDDLKISHREQSPIDEFLSNLRAEFGQEDELTESSGLIHDYLGMTIDYSLPDKVVFTMFDFLEDIIVEAPADLKSSRSCYPGNGALFKVDKGSPLLSPDKADLFHRLVARLLFASKRARPDLQVCIAFLCTRVKAPTNEDYMKLGRVITYLSETIHLPLVIGADNSGTMTWNVDASFAVHPDCKSHTGASLTLGHGSLLSLSCKQKINTKSSTEAELVGVDDAMTFVMWMRHFFQSQVQHLNNTSVLKPLGEKVVIEQDNTSAIQLQRNGWGSSGKRTKHINVRYFYITDRLRAGEVTRVVHKPTEAMESDFLTKALQGQRFYAHRATLMGLNNIDEYQFYNKFKQKG